MTYPMRIMIRVFLAALFLCVLASAAMAGDVKSVLESIKWQEGPSIANVGAMSELKMEDGFVFADGDDTRKLMAAMENFTSNMEQGLVGPSDLHYFVIFEFEETGYVKDDDKGDLDADAMLKQMQEAQVESNKARAEKGWGIMNVDGWEVAPAYNSETNNIEWAIRYSSNDGTVVNFITKYLGRRGVMVVTLVCDPADLKATLPEFRRIMKGFSYKGGHKYAEYTKGDKVAAYGLTALVVGGAAAAAAKTGLLKYLGKIIVAGAIAVAAFFKKIKDKVKSLFSRKDAA